MIRRKQEEIITENTEKRSREGWTQRNIGYKKCKQTAAAVAK